MKLVIPILVTLNLFGCVIKLKDNGKLSFFTSTEWGVKHETAETKAESVSTWDYKPLVDYILQLRKPITVEEVPNGGTGNEE